MLFKGTCDVCGEAVSLEHNPADGIIDYKIASDGRMITWVRHAPKGGNPDCAIYSSEVVEVREGDRQ